MLLAHDIVLFNDGERKFETFIGNNDIQTFISSYDYKSEVLPLLQGGFKDDACARGNPVVIDGKTIMLESQTKFWQNPNKKFEFEFNCFLTPKQKIVNTDTLRKESIIVTQAMRQLREAWCNVFFIGQNGGFKNTADLIRQVKAMIKYSRCFISQMT